MNAPAVNEDVWTSATTRHDPGRTRASAPHVLAACFVLAVGALAAPRSASAQRSDGPSPITSSVEAASLVAPEVAVSEVPIAPALHASAWRGGILLDEAARDGLRLERDDAREIAASVSDALLLTSMVGTLALDGLAAPLAQGDTRLAWQSTSANLLALGLTLFAGEVVKHAVGRARPFERACREDPTLPQCSNEDTFASFYSLHTGMAFTSAGFSCAMHVSHSLYGDRAADAAACGVSLALAATTGLLRVVADRHYLSDVLIGGLLGFLVGYAVPMLLVPARGSTASAAEASTGIPALAPDDASAAGLGSVGVTFSGTF